MEEAARGASALEKSDFALAITHYTNAIDTNPGAVPYYIKRSTAYTRLSPADHAAALKDAEVAVVLAYKRGKRELLWQSQLRRAIALFGLGRWGDAQACFKRVEKLNKDEKSLKIWVAKVEDKLKGLAEDDERGKTNLKEIPEVDLPDLEVKKGKQKNDDGKVAAGPDSPDSKAKSEGVKTPAGKIRHEWYQTTDHVVVTLFAKGVPKDKATIDIQEKSLSISFPMPNSSEFEFSLDPLYSPIVPSASSAKIMSTKAEFTLKKRAAGEKWHSLEGSELTKPLELSDNKTDDASSAAAIKRAVLASKPPPPSSAPLYPTSSKTGPKNWDKLASELTKKPTKKKKGDSTTADGKKEKEEEDGGGDDADDDGGAVDDDMDVSDPVQGFFQKIYKDADPDTKRAMIKSYQESNGTSLSTNWSEVGKGPVETSPPEGMVAKKWKDWFESEIVKNEKYNTSIAAGQTSLNWSRDVYR